MWRSLTALACVCGFILGQGSSAHAAEVDYQRINERLERLSSQKDLMGIAVGIVENGEVTFLKGYGKTGLEGTPVTPDTVFRWASLSKGVAGSLAAVLEHEGKLDMTIPISVWPTTLALPENGTSSATVEHLLSHRVGIVPNAYDTRLEDGKDPADIRPTLADLKQVCPPGTCHSYQNVAFDAFAEISEAVTGKPYTQMVKERFFEPLGMTSASFTMADLENAPDHAEPHNRHSKLKVAYPTKLNENYYRVPAAGAVNSSIRDLTTWMQAQMGLFPDVIPQEALDRAHSEQVGTLGHYRYNNRRWGRLRAAHYGLGWRVYDYSGSKTVGHRGAVRGYRAMIMFDPEIDSGIVALWNTGMTQPVGLQYEVMDMFYGLGQRDWMRIDPKES